MQSVKNIDQKGYTLVELLMSVVVAGILFAAVFALYSNILIIQGKTARLETATRAAHQEIETLRNLQYNSLIDGEVIDFSSELPNTLPIGSTGVVEVTDNDDGLKRVDVSVTYQEEGVDKVVTVSSLIGIIGITQ